MRLILFLLFPIFLSAQITRSYGVIEIGGFPISSTTGPKFAYNPADSSFYRWSHGSVWVKIIEPSITSDTIFITDQIGTSYVVSGDTINLTPYLLESDTTAMLVKYIERGDTASMLTNYPSTAGYGIIDGGKTWRVDTTSPNGLATRLFAKTLPTSILADRLVRSNGSNLVAGNLSDNGTRLAALLPWQFQTWTTAGRPSGVTGYWGFNTSDNAQEWYNGTRWARVPESTVGTFTTNRIPYTDANGQLTQGSGLNYNGTQLLLTPSTAVGKKLFINSTATPVATGIDIDLGGKYSGTATSVPKLAIYNDGTYQFGFGMWNNGLSYIVDHNTLGHYFYAGVDSTLKLSITKSLVNFPQLVTVGTTATTGLLMAIGSQVTGTQARLYVESPDQGIGSGIRVKSTNTSTSGYASVYLESANGEFSQFFSTNSTYAAYRAISASSFGHYSSAANGMAIQLDGASAVLKVGLGVNEITRVTTGGYGIKTTAPLQELDVNGDAYIRDSTRLTTTPSHTAITGLLTRDATGWVGLGTIGTGLSYAAGVLSATGTADGNGIYSSSATLANHTTRARVPDDGNLFFSQTYNTTDSAYIQIVNNLDGNREVRMGLTDTASTGFSKLRVYQDEVNEEMGWEILTDDGTGTTAIGGQGGNLSLYADAVGTVEVRGQELRLNNGEVSMNQYGQGNMKASDLSATDSKFVAKFGDAGKVLDYYLARDTFIEDVTLFSVGTLMNDCQELTVVSSMTSTAPTHQEIRFPDAGDHLRGKKIIVYQKKKEAGIYVPQIKVVGGVSRLYFTTTPGIGGTDPSDQSTLSIDDSTWSSHGTTFEFTCLRIDNTPSYRWVLKQR